MAARLVLEVLGATVAGWVAVRRRLGMRTGQPRRGAAARERNAPFHGHDLDALAEFTDCLGHDLNNVLTGISGSLEVMAALLAQGRHDAVARHLALARQEARRAAGLTQQLLAFPPRPTPDPVPTNVGALLADLYGKMQEAAGTAADIHVHAAADAWPVSVDARQLRAALLGLCAHARDAMPAGGRLTVRASNLPFGERAARMRGLLPGQYLRLAVTDNGTGTRPDIAGAGPGLSEVDGFARQSGGRAHLRSVPGRGTTVCLYLPRHHGSPLPALLPPPPSASPAVLTVLVVEDEAAVRVLVSEALTRQGHAVVAVEDGAAGLAALRSDRPLDVLVTDVGLAGDTDGCQLADAAQQARPGLPVLFMTGYAGAATLGSVLCGPDRQVITKPFALAALASQVAAMAAVRRNSPAEHALG